MRAGNAVLTRGAVRMLIVFGALVLSAVIIASVSANGGFLSSLGKPVQTGAFSGYAIAFLIILFFISGFIVEVIMFFIRGRTSMKGAVRRGEKRSSFVLNSIISLAFLFALVALYFLLNSRRIAAGHLNRTVAPAIINRTSPLGGITGGGSLFSAAGGLIIGLVVVLAVVMAALSVLFTMQSLREHGDGAAGEDVVSAVEDIERSIEEIKESTDPREAILDAYRSMCTLLSAKGVENRGWWTAREFESRVTERFKLPILTVSELTSLFEEAKYSRHALGEGERVRAVALLEKVREELMREDSGGVAAK